MAAKLWLVLKRSVIGTLVQLWRLSKEQIVAVLLTTYLGICRRPFVIFLIGGRQHIHILNGSIVHISV